MAEIEIEVRGYLKDEKEYKQLIKRFDTKLGTKKSEKRLVFRFGELEKMNIDTGIRVTNDGIILMQKIGFINDLKRIEHKSDLSSFSMDQVMAIIQAFKNMESEYSSPLGVVMQNENYYFEDNQFEIKLSHQFGKSDIYFFEIESKAEEDLNKFAKENGLEIMPDFNDTPNFIKIAEEVNLSIKDLNEEEILNLIRKYNSNI